jgi:hypothetical protein
MANDCYPSLVPLVSWLTDPHAHPSTSMTRCDDAATRILAKMVDLGLIEGRHHPHTWSNHPTVYRVDGRIFGRTDGVDDLLFDGQSMNGKTIEQLETRCSDATPLLGDLADIFRLLDAVGTAANFFDEIRSRSEASEDTTLFVVAEQMRRQLVGTELLLRQIIENSVCPVWGEVSDLVREKCRACGLSIA